MQATCAYCGSHLIAELPDSWCLRCLAAVISSSDEISSIEINGSGRLFGDYEIEGEIAAGGMGVVYLAHQRSLGRAVALKMMRSGIFATADEVKRFRLESEAAARLDHPHILPIYEVGECEGRFYFTMRLMEGGSLAEHSAGQQTRDAAWIRHAAGLVATVSRAAHHAHERGILHRDIKPTNILIDSQGAAHLSDFGLAKFAGSPAGRTRSGAVLGTPSYMAPEQAAGRAEELTESSDVYSLGTVLYELLTGRVPFAGDSVWEVLKQVQESDPPAPKLINPDVEVDLQSICLKCLEKRPESRYRSASELADDLDRYLAGEPVAARSPSLVERWHRRARRHKAGFAIAAFGLLSLLVVSGGIFWNLRDRSVQRTAAEVTIERALLQASAAYRNGDLPEARAALGLAENLVASAPVGPRLRTETKRWGRDLRMVTRLEDIRIRHAVVAVDRFDEGLVDVAYREAFKEFGLNAEHLDAESAAEALKGSPIGRELAVALDHWAACCRFVDLEDSRWKHFSTLAGEIDPDPARNRLRSFWGRQASEVTDDLRALAESTEPSLESPATVQLLSQTLLRAGLGKEAVEVLRRAQRRAPEDFWINFTLGNRLIGGETPEGAEAAGFLRAALAQRPENVGTLISLAHALDLAGAPTEEATAPAREAVRLEPRFARAWASLGDILQRRGVQTEAEKALRQAVRLEPLYYQAHHALALSLYSQKRYEESEAACREALRLQAGDARIWLNLGNVLAAQGRIDEAVAALRESVRLAPDDGRARHNLGIYLLDQGKPEEAEIELREAVRLRPGSGRTHFNLGYCLNLRGRHAEAELEAREAIRLSPNNATYYVALASVLRAQDRPKEGEVVSRQAIRLDPDAAAAHLELGRNLIAQKKDGEAEAALRESVRLNDESQEAIQELGETLARIGRWKEAIAMLEKAVELRPESVLSLTELAKVLTMCEDESLRDSTRALALTQKAIDLKPESFWAWQLSGWAHCRAGHWQKAVQALENSCRLETNGVGDEWQWLALSVAHAHLQHRDEALRWYHRAVLRMDSMKFEAPEPIQFRKEAEALIGPTALDSARRFVAERKWDEAAQAFIAVVKSLDGGPDWDEARRQLWEQAVEEEEILRRLTKLRVADPTFQTARARRSEKRLADGESSP